MGGDNTVGNKRRKLRQEDEEKDQSQSSDSSIPSSEPSSTSSEDDSDGCAFDSIDVDFEFFDPDEDDFHGIKTLLGNYLDGNIYKCSELVEDVMSTPGSTVVKCGEEGNIIGIAAVIETNKDVYEYARRHCPESLKENFEKIVAQGTKVRCILLERLINSPPQLAPPLMDAILVPEVEEGVDAFYILGRGYKHGKGELIFALPEYEFLYNEAKLKFDFVPPVREALVEKSMDNPNPARFVAVLDKKSLYKACEELKKVVQGIP
jgi:hypothetical protein